jgi:F-type H+-transporting ATPase subunit b
VIGQLPTLFAATEAAAEEAEGIAALGLDPLAILAQAFTFIVLFYIVKKYALDGIVKTLEDRRKTINDGVSLGFTLREEREKLADTVDKELAKARKAADGILSDANKEAGSIVRAAQDEASTKVEGMISDAHVRIADDIVKAKNELKGEVTNLVAEATGAVLGEKLDSKKDQDLIKRMLAGVEK